MERSLLESPVQTISRMETRERNEAKLSPAIAAAVDAIRRQWDGTPSYAIILGTGLGHLAERIDTEVAIPYRSIPGFPVCSALAHKGQLVCGRLMGVPVVAQQGRSHLYEGFSFSELQFATRVMAALGAGRLIVSNAAGGVNPLFKSGDVMLIEDHINLMFPHMLGDSVNETPSNHPPGATAGSSSSAEFAAAGLPGSGVLPRYKAFYDPELCNRALDIALAKRVPLQRGVYLSVTGPNYETRAEYRAFRRMGADAVGMSTVPEVLAAHEAGMAVLGFSAITNIARPDAPDIVDAHEVLDVAEFAAPKLQAIVMGILSDEAP